MRVELALGKIVKILFVTFLFFSLVPLSFQILSLRCPHYSSVPIINWVNHLALSAQGVLGTRNTYVYKPERIQAFRELPQTYKNQAKLKNTWKKHKKIHMLKRDTKKKIQKPSEKLRAVSCGGKVYCCYRMFVWLFFLFYLFVLLSWSGKWASKMKLINLLPHWLSDHWRKTTELITSGFAYPKVWSRYLYI